MTAVKVVPPDPTQMLGFAGFICAKSVGEIETLTVSQNETVLQFPITVPQTLYCITGGKPGWGVTITFVCPT